MVLNESSRKRARKNQGIFEDWERSKIKKSRELGQSYYSLSKRKDQNKQLVQRSARKLLPQCNSKKCEKSVKKKMQ